MAQATGPARRLQPTTSGALTTAAAPAPEPVAPEPEAARTATYAKLPGASMPYSLDWTGELDGNTITTSTWDHPPTLTSTTPAVVGRTTSIRLAGGSAGHAYRVWNTVVDSAGRTLTRSLNVHVTNGEGMASWATAEDLLAVTNGVPVGTDTSSALMAATTLLWRLSGRQFGLRWRTVRPRAQACPSCGGWWGISSAWLDWSGYGRWDHWMTRTNSGGFCGRPCDGTRVILPGRPYALSSVVLEGQVLEEDAYALDSKRRLVRVDGDIWPLWQDERAPLGQANTWSVTYLSGKPVPEDGRRAVAEFAGQLVLAQVGSSACQLPGRLQSIARQDVSMTFMDTRDFSSEGGVGLHFPDIWLRSVNPRRLQRGATILRADDPRRH